MVLFCCRISLLMFCLDVLSIDKSGALISSLRLKHCFAGYGILSWQLFLVIASIILLHALLAFRVCVERAEVIFMYLPLCVSWCFFFPCGFQYSFFVL
jgi:hypothetical protein